MAFKSKAPPFGAAKAKSKAPGKKSPKSKRHPATHGYPAQPPMM